MSRQFRGFGASSVKIWPCVGLVPEMTVPLEFFVPPAAQ